LNAKTAKLGILGIPYNIGSVGIRVEKGSEALRNAKIVEALRSITEVIDFGDLKVDLPPQDFSNSKLLNSKQVQALCIALSNKVEEIVAKECLPFIIGGEDSALMGIVAGLKRSEPALSMIYMDAHGDFNTPETSPSGNIGGMDVAIASGRGPKDLTEMFGRRPLLSEENIVLYGVRDLDPQEEEALVGSRVQVHTRDRIRKSGAEKTAKNILKYLEEKCAGIYLHVDLDVLDKSVVSAVGLPVPDGLSADEFKDTVKVFLGSGKLNGLAIMVFDAAKDPKGREAKKAVNLIVDAFSR
jgi:arginase